jgi:hypothetical protein
MDIECGMRKPDSFHIPNIEMKKATPIEPPFYFDVYLQITC